MSDTLNTLTSAQKEYKDSNTLSAKTLENLSKQYPKLSTKITEYAAGLIDIKDLINEFPALYEAEKQAYIESVKLKLTSSETFYQKNILSQVRLVDSYKTNYGIDLNNFTTLAKAKAEIESNLIKGLSEIWAEYYNSVGGNATKTVEAMQNQLDHLYSAKKNLSFSMDPNTSKTINAEIEHLEAMIQSFQPLIDLEKIEANIDFKGVEGKINGLLDNIGKGTEKKTKGTAKKVEDILKDTYDKQLKIAQDYLNKRQKQIDDEYKSKVKKINDIAESDKKALDNWYSNQKEKVQSSIKAIDDLISAKRKAREDEKLDENLSFTQKRIVTLQNQIKYSRNPWEKEELEKELSRQKEELKDLSVQKEVSELEKQKKVHENKLSQIEEQYKLENEYIEERRKNELEAIEDAKNKTLSSLEKTFTQFQDDLAVTYGYVNNETLDIGKRFVNATVGAIEGGFDVVAKKSQDVIDNMINQIERKIKQLNSMVNRVSTRYAESNRGDYYNEEYSDNRSMNVTNHITRGYTDGQLSSILNRQAERFLYGRR